MNALTASLSLLLLGHRLVAQQGQNLLFNGSFEERMLDQQGELYCPLSSGLVDLALGWHSLLDNADYMHTCSNTIYSGVPQNRGGYQYPEDGDAYVSIGGYRPWYPNLREFVWIELPEALKAGYGYEFEGWVSLLDSMNFAMAGFGALFTDHDMWDWTSVIYTDSVLNQHPQVINPYDSLLDDKENWMRVSGYFVAEGGEKFMTVGFFRKDEDDNIQRVSNHPEATYNWEGAGYYVDGLALYEVSGLSTAEPEAAMLQLHPNPTSGLLSVNALGYDMSTLAWEVSDLAGKVSLSGRVQGGTIDLSTMEAGTYLIRFSQNGRPVQSIKVVLSE